MKPKFILGIDSGTSVVKSVVFDLTGKEISVARREMPTINSQSDWNEVDMEELWEVVANSIKEVVAVVGGETIAAIGVTGTCSGVWPIDETGQPTRRAILWNDYRANDIIAKWQASGLYSRIFAVSGCAPLSGYTLPSLVWLQQHEPEALKRTRWFFFHKDWLRFNLTGDIHVEESDVSYIPGDARARTYNAEIFKACGLDDCLQKLPPIVHSFDVVGEITNRAAQRLGLPTGIPVVAGAVDVVASTLGGGAFQAGQACSILGTSFLNSIVVDHPVFTPLESGAEVSMPNGIWLRSVINTSGTLNIDWLLENLAYSERVEGKRTGRNVFEIIEERVTKLPEGSHGVMFLPYLNPAGINSPFPEPNARALFFGLSAQNNRYDLMRAVYEGAVLSMRDCYNTMGQSIGEVILVGGGARSAFWAQLCADATGYRIITTVGEETGARGVAILAGIGSGLFSSVEAAVKAMVQTDHVFSPRPIQSQIYDTLYELYRHLYTSIRESWHVRQKVIARVEELLQRI